VGAKIRINFETAKLFLAKLRILVLNCHKYFVISPKSATFAATNQLFDNGTN
jgi:hypothetical protein